MKTISSALFTVAKLLHLFILLLFILPLDAAVEENNSWLLDESQSSVFFTSIKKGTVAEAHTFRRISGSINNNKALIKIDASSVDMLIPIRNERALEFLFESKAFPEIYITSNVRDAIKVASAANTEFINFPAYLSLHGVTKEIMLNVSITRNGEHTITVTSNRPIIINASDYNMARGLAKLSELVGNIPIASSVPVNFTLTFKRRTKQS